MATTIPDLTASQFADRLSQLLPPAWFSDAAKAPGGVFYTLMLAIGTELAFLNDSMIYARNAGNINLATDSALDTISASYFGSKLPRFPNESDDSYRARVIGSLLPDGVTRDAIIEAVLDVTGTTPRFMEPWSPKDTCVWDYTSYWDVDVKDKAPFRWATPELRNQAFIEVTLPSTHLSTNPVWCFDGGFSWDAPDAAWNDPSSSFFVQEAQVDDTINGVKPAGTIIWRKFV